MDKLRVQPPDEVIEDSLTFIRDVAEATQQATQPTLDRSTFNTVTATLVLLVAAVVYMEPCSCLFSFILGLTLTLTPLLFIIAISTINI